MDPLPLLEQYFGYQQFRSNQQEIITSVISGHDTLAILPTGGGKSVCYQIPALALPGTTIVISPLISLMQDQVAQLTARGIPATCLTSGLTSYQLQQRQSALAAGEYRLLYVSPERLQSPVLLSLLKRLTIPLVAVDEAHCISQWGHDFRPEYRLIHRCISSFPKRPTLMALTATATNTVKADIVKSLRLQQPRIFLNSFRRHNLFLGKLACQTTWQRDFHMMAFFAQPKHLPGLIYVSSRKKAQFVQASFNHFFPQLKTGLYHAGLTATERATTQALFLANELSLVIATSAFGMGVDKPNVRSVLHYHLPTSLEEYYQEAGRAGRDGETSACVILDHRPSEKIPMSLVAQQSSSHLKSWQALQRYVRSRQCRHRQLLAHFGEKTTDGVNCGMCDICSPGWNKTSPTDKNLYRRLLVLRKNLPPSQINPLPISVCSWLTLLKPATATEALRIPGIGKAWIDHYWEDVYAVISSN